MSDAPDTLCHLRRRLAWTGAVEPRGSRRSLSLSVETVDDALGGGLALGTLHELSPAGSADVGAATGFILALATLAQMQSRPVLWIQNAFARIEAGALYGPGLDCLGLSIDRLVTLEVTRGGEALWAMEEALKCRAVKVVIAELYDDKPADLTAMRRLSLAAHVGGGLGLLLRHRTCATPSAAVTRWEVASVLSLRDQFGGLGRMAFALSLTKNRYGPCGQWILTWDHHARVFHSATLPLGVAETTGDRSDRSLRRAG